MYQNVPIELIECIEALSIISVRWLHRADFALCPTWRPYATYLRRSMHAPSRSGATMLPTAPSAGPTSG